MAITSDKPWQDKWFMI